MAMASCGLSTLNSCTKSSKRACCCRVFMPGGRVASFLRVRCMRSWRPFCWGWPCGGSLGQHVGQESPDELVEVQYRRLPPFGSVDAVVFPAERDGRRTAECWCCAAAARTRISYLHSRTKTIAIGPHAEPAADFAVCSRWITKRLGGCRSGLRARHFIAAPLSQRAMREPLGFVAKGIRAVVPKLRPAP